MFILVLEFNHDEVQAVISNYSSNTDSGTETSANSNNCGPRPNSQADNINLNNVYISVGV